jgi:hypothetical protein
MTWQKNQFIVLVDLEMVEEEVKGGDRQRPQSRGAALRS